SGQLQKSISHAEKGLEIAERTKNPRLKLNATLELKWSYESVGRRERSRQLLDRMFETVKEIPPNTDLRANWEGNLYDELGRDLMREREYSKAIDAYLAAKSSHQLFLSRISKVASAPTDVAQGNIIGNLISLGTLYIRTGQLEQALSQYLNAFALIKQWGLKYPYPDSLHQGMGEIFLQQKNFPEALENFQKAVALAEGQRSPGSIR